MSFLSVKKVLKILLFTKTVKKLDPYISCFQKGVHIEEFFDESKYMCLFL